MGAVCPAGHDSSTSDYCDTCGAAIAPAASPPSPSGAPEIDTACPNCGSPRGVADVFCEVCGLDFATGEMPSAPAPAPLAASSAAPAAAPSGWVAVIVPDRAYFDRNDPDPDATGEFPEGVPPREVELSGDDVLIGRRSDRGGVFPDIDLGTGVPDAGVSRRHASIEREGDGWVVVDLDSTNGTRVNDAPDPIAPNTRVALADGDHLHVGAWTRITLERREVAR